MAPLRASESIATRLTRIASPSRDRRILQLWPALLAGLSMALILSLSGCQTEDPPEAETVLWVRLNDSLSKYDKVVVQIVDRNDSSLVIYTMWNKPLPSPGKDIPPYPLKSLANQPFVLKITAYTLDGQLAVYTQITYEGGKKSVYHKEVPPLIARDWLTRLTPSNGTLLPPFNKDSLTYVMDLARDAMVSFTMATASGQAATTVDGEAVAAGAASKPYTVGERDTIPVEVTDMSTGTASKRTYNVIIIPTAPPSLTLGKLVPSAGSLSPAFSPNNKVYSLMLPKGVDTVAFMITPSDPATMTMTVAGKNILTGQRSQTFKVEPGSTFPIPIEVFQGPQSAYYQVTLELYRDP